MGEASRIESVLREKGPLESEDLLPLVYDELRALASRRMSRESPDQTLQPTALVHEAYLRLVDAGNAHPWNSRGHFFGAAAEAMRRILIERARRQAGPKRGGGRRRVPLGTLDSLVTTPPDELLALDDALARLGAIDADAAQLVKLRYFAGLTMPQCADALGISLRGAERDWTYARTWLHRELGNG